jgi:pimeloyl-ACP methyl ester carboxylesterase
MRHGQRARAATFFPTLAALLLLGFGSEGRADPVPATGLADAAALRATVYGTPPQDIAPLPERVPLQEINIKLPWARPLPPVLWFDARLRAWLAPQDHPAPLVIVIPGTGSDGNSSKLSTLRAILYGAGYHVLTLPSPTFPGFIASASSTGVAGDFMQDGRDLYAAAQAIIARLPARLQITEIDVVGYSLGGANAAMMKSLDASEHRLNIRRAVMINPPVSMFASIDRLDRLFAQSIGTGDEAIDRFYRRIYVRLANFYRASERIHIEDTDLLAAAGAVLRTDSDFSAAIALSFRLALMDVFFAGDLYAGTGVVVDPRHPPRPGDPTAKIARELRDKPFSEYFDRVFVPYYLAHRPGATRASLIAENRLSVIGATLHDDPDYYALTNSDDVILDAEELQWLKTTLGARIAVFDHGGHLGNLGDRQQASDMLQMLAGHWQGSAK